MEKPSVHRLQRTVDASEWWGQSTAYRLRLERKAPGVALCLDQRQRDAPPSPAACRHSRAASSSCLHRRFGTEDSLVEYNVVVGDVLLPHNIGNLTWATNGTFSKASECLMPIEDRLSFTLDNHAYVEHSLQHAYTAATFFLFQNGVVKDAIKLSSGQTTLSFQNNVQTIAVLVSIPNQNAWLTAAGCAVLVLGLLAAVVKAVYFTPKDSDPLAAITAPQVIARVMLDDQQFPPMLLHRQVLDKQDSLNPRKIDHFSIAGLSVKHQADADKHDAMEERGKVTHAEKSV